MFYREHKTKVEALVNKIEELVEHIEKLVSHVEPRIASGFEISKGTNGSTDGEVKKRRGPSLQVAPRDQNQRQLENLKELKEKLQDDLANIKANIANPTKAYDSYDRVSSPRALAFKLTDSDDEPKLIKCTLLNINDAEGYIKALTAEFPSLKRPSRGC